MEPEIGISKGEAVLSAKCREPGCKWFLYDLKIDEEDFDKEVAEHKQWHEDGMPE